MLDFETWTPALQKIAEADEQASFLLLCFKILNHKSEVDEKQVKLFYRCKGLVEHDRVLTNREQKGDQKRECN